MGAACTGILAALATACAGGLDKMSESDVDASEKATAQRLATKIYEGCRDGRYEALGGGEAVGAMRDSLTPTKLASTCASIQGSFGTFVSMDYVETWRPTFGATRVYRFKGHFASTPETPEIRVVMERSRLSGFWLKPWSDTLR